MRPRGRERERDRVAVERVAVDLSALSRKLQTVHAGVELGPAPPGQQVDARDVADCHQEAERVDRVHDASRGVTLVATPCRNLRGCPESNHPTDGSDLADGRLSPTHARWFRTFWRNWATVVIGHRKLKRFGSRSDIENWHTHWSRVGAQSHSSVESLLVRTSTPARRFSRSRKPSPWMATTWASWSSR